MEETLEIVDANLALQNQNKSNQNIDAIVNDKNTRKNKSICC